MRSRLARRSEKQTKKQLYISIGGIIATLFILYQLGPIVLTGTGAFLDSLFGKNKTQINYLSNAPYQTPIIDPIPTATPSSELVVSGKTIYSEGVVEIYVNDDLARETEVLESNDFKTTVTLTSDTNTIKARYINGDKTSGFTDEHQISYIKEAPSLDITFPSDNASFSTGDQQITVSGKTNSDSAITVNGRIAIVTGDGAFSHMLNLSEGENKITVEASNTAGKKTEKTITVSYKP
jgi:hypothetical protein